MTHANMSKNIQEKHRVRFDVSSANGCTQIGHNVGLYITNNKYTYENLRSATSFKRPSSQNFQIILHKLPQAKGKLLHDHHIK